MKSSVLNLYRPAKRRLQRVLRKSKDGEQVRRATALLHLDRSGNVSETADSVAAARSSVYRWVSWFVENDVEGLRSQTPGRHLSTVTHEVVGLLLVLLEKKPSEYGYLRVTWCSELLALEIRAQLGNEIHASTVRRLLPLLGYGYRRARPFLFRTDPRKQEKLALIEEAIGQRKPGVGVFYVDEADVNLNPKIGFGWRAIGRQELVPTPGENEKRYLAGALNAHTGKVVWTESKKKDSNLFIELLVCLRRAYRGLKRIVVILDNVNYHSSHRTRAFLARNPKFELLFQPVYHPWVNRIERLWKALHDTVTRNHRHQNIEELMVAVRHFMVVASPFPGSGQATARMAA